MFKWSLWPLYTLNLFECVFQVITTLIGNSSFWSAMTQPAVSSSRFLSLRSTSSICLPPCRWRGFLPSSICLPPCRWRGFLPSWLTSSSYCRRVWWRRQVLAAIAWMTIFYCRRAWWRRRILADISCSRVFTVVTWMTTSSWWHRVFTVPWAAYSMDDNVFFWLLMFIAP